MTHAGRGSMILDVERTLYIHSWWSNDKIETYAVRHEAELTFINNTVYSTSLNLVAYNGRYNASVELEIVGGGMKSKSSS